MYIKKQKPGKLFFLLPLGLLLCSAVQLISRWINIPDFPKGVLMGVGIGLMLITLTFKKFQGKNNRNNIRSN